jgi:DNA (cytosine-5)-methyltransferase 1
MAELGKKNEFKFWEEFKWLPKQKLIKRLKDALEDEVDEKYFLSEKALSFFTLNDKKMKESGNGFRFKPTTGNAVAKTISTKVGNRMDDNFIIIVKSATKAGYEVAQHGDSINLSVPNSKTRRGRVGKQVAQTLDTQCNQAIIQDRIRKLTPRECLRLQDFPDDFKIVVSDSRAYKQAGNSMSVNVLEMIFKQILKAKSNEPTNTLFDFLEPTCNQ